MVSVLWIILIKQCLCQIGFPKQFQTILNVTGDTTSLTLGVRQLLYDYENLRVRFDIKGWRSGQNETYMIKYKPEGAESDSVSRLSSIQIK